MQLRHLSSVQTEVVLISSVPAFAPVKPGGWVTFSNFLRPLLLTRSVYVYDQFSNYSTCVDPVPHAYKEVDVNDESYVPTCDKDKE